MEIPKHPVITIYKLLSFYFISNTYSSASFLMPSHSLIFFCLVPFCVSHLQSQNTTDLMLIIYQYAVYSVYKSKHRENQISNFPYIKYWSLILRSCMRSGLRLFIFLSISLLSETCSLRSCSSLRLLSWISFTRDFKRSELLWILIWQSDKTMSMNLFLKCLRKKEKKVSSLLWIYAVLHLH